MSTLAVLSLRNRALIALITIVAAVFGGLALTNLKQELIPSIEFPQLAIVSNYPGASPEVVEHDVSTPVETAIQGVPGLDTSTATSTTNSSVIQASFAYGTNLATAEQKINQAIGRIKSQLPEGVDPQVITASIDDFPVIQLAVTGFSDAEKAQQRLTNTIIPKIERLKGVNAASLVGGQGKRLTITPDNAAVLAAGLAPTAIKDALQQNGTLFPGGSITEDDTTLTVQTGEKLTSVEQIEAIPLIGATVPGTTVGSVAHVAIEGDPVTSLSRVDGKSALTIAVTKLPSANTVDVSKAVTALIPQLRKDLPGATFTTVFDQAPFIQQSIESLAQEGLLGLVFAVIVILIFLLSVRSTLVTAISIPTSVLITFIGIQAFGYSLNILTLGALTIAIGRVVDDSIVVIENIKRHYVQGSDKKTAILSAVREVATAVTASTITTVAVFLPIAFVGDMTGELFRPFALTVTIAMTASLLVALTIVPVLAYWFLRPGKPLIGADGHAIDPEHEDAPPTRLQRAYLPILRWTLKHSWITVLLAVVVLIGTMAAAPLMKVNFLGSSGQNTFRMSQSLGEAPSLDAEDAAAQKVEEAIKDVPGIKTVQVSIGSSGSALRDAFSGGGSGISYSITTDPSADQERVQSDVRTAVKKLEGVGDIAIAASEGFGSSDIEVKITAPDEKTLDAATNALVKELKGSAGVNQVSSNLSASLPYIAVQVDRTAAAQHGLSEVAVGGIVSQAMRPQQIGSVEIDGSSLTVYLQSANPPTTVDELKALTIPSRTGIVRLDQIATVQQSESPASVTTQRGQRTATVSVTPKGNDLASASAAVSKAIAKADLPSGADASLGGVVTQQQDAFGQLGLAMLAAILIVYIVMVATFKSLRQPILLLSSVPFAATGAILLQIVTGVPLGVASLIGVLMLIGIVVTNAIVLVDLVNQYREKGMNTHDATIAGGSRRLRPILMTALATIFALTPMALGVTGHGGFISQPLAIVVIGGLVSSTVLTLLVLPTLYNLVEGAKERRAARRAAKAGGSGDAPAPAEADAPAPAEADAPAAAEAPAEPVAAPPSAASAAPSGVTTAASPEPATSTAQLSAIRTAYADGAEVPAHHPTRRELRQHGPSGVSSGSLSEDTAGD
ncbi:RND multidrug efflux transporter; Acriflavin resistance protein [Microbacterium sp. 8M]|uniref:efflux RND transporter permease subunit n=1 Tax=Microbacterium sp. 8M TaxID=2653153 RepID=UPI0012F0D482|nr:efflux RND transporter permease subunit [Microbacterium sp. 8M]VXB44188.1 RND multidrug efflux transporter; Acriflavin resistance protein [Microbacterium sp. 8M]